MRCNATELEAVENWAAPQLADIRAFFADNPPDETVMEWLAWTYEEICKQVAVEYAKPITANEVPY